MSLAPGERQALARIENSLCRSDPGLATMLVTFTLPARRGRASRWRGLCGGALRARRLIVAGLVVAALCLAVAVLVRHGSGNPLCTQFGRKVIAGGQALSCRPARGAAPSRLSRPAGFSGGPAHPGRPAMRCGADPGAAAAGRSPGGMTGRKAGKC